MTLLPEKGDWRGLSLLVAGVILLAVVLGFAIAMISDYGGFAGFNNTPGQHTTPPGKSKG